MADLQLDWCSYDAAKYAVENWHYSECMPTGKTCKVGVWENANFIGVVIFSRGGSKHLGDAFGLDQTKVCELTRIALDEHDTPVSRIGSISLSLFQDQNPGMRLVISYADPYQDHTGTIYQAMNWIYVGRSTPKRVLKLDGEILHNRTAYELPPSERDRGEWIQRPPKYKYLYPLDDEMRERVEPLAKPYP